MPSLVFHMPKLVSHAPSLASHTPSLASNLTSHTPTIMDKSCGAMEITIKLCILYTITIKLCSLHFPLFQFWKQININEAFSNIVWGKGEVSSYKNKVLWLVLKD